MSIPANPLANYTSYSYHHVLMATNSTNVANYFYAAGKNEKGEAVPAVDFETDIFQQRGVGDLRYNAIPINDGAVVVLIDSRTDANFLINKVEWNTILAPTDGGLDPATSIAVDGKLQIVEPISSSRFLNTVRNAYATLNTDSTNTVFILKTFFYGYRDNGEPDIYSNVNPVSFVMLDLKADFSVSGAIYDIEFISITNGVGSLGETSTVTNVLPSFSTGTSPILENVIQSFTKQLNEATQKNFLEVVKQYEGTGYQLVPVSYTVTLDERYKAADYIIAFNNTRTDEKGDKGATHQSISFGTSLDVVGALNVILKKCPKIIDEGKDPKAAIQFKIISSVTILPIKPEDVNPPGKYVINYHIVPFQQVKSTFDDLLSGTSETTIPLGDKRVLQLFYLYTGKNTDIIEFKINMEMGLGFLQTIAINTNNEPKPAEAPKDGGTYCAAPVTETKTKNKVIIVTPGIKMRDPKKIHNTSNPKDVTLFDQQLAQWASYEGLEAAITIMGNPNLLSLFNPSTEKAKDQDWAKGPFLAKVDVKQLNPDTGEITNFWYQGYYYMMEIAHSFSEGEFIQQIQMMSLPVNPSAKTVEPVEGDKQTELADNTKVEENTTP